MRLLVTLGPTSICLHWTSVDPVPHDWTDAPKMTYPPYLSGDCGLVAGTSSTGTKWLRPTRASPLIPAKEIATVPPPTRAKFAVLWLGELRRPSCSIEITAPRYACHWNPLNLRFCAWLSEFRCVLGAQPTDTSSGTSLVTVPCQLHSDTRV